jgi:hypothetical protein
MKAMLPIRGGRQFFVFAVIISTGKMLTMCMGAFALFILPGTPYFIHDH